MEHALRQVAGQNLQLFLRHPWFCRSTPQSMISVGMGAADCCAAQLVTFKASVDKVYLYIMHTILIILFQAQDAGYLLRHQSHQLRRSGRNCKQRRERVAGKPHVSSS